MTTKALTYNHSFQCECDTEQNRDLKECELLISDSGYFALYNEKSKSSKYLHLYIRNKDCKSLEKPHKIHVEMEDCILVEEL